MRINIFYNGQQGDMRKYAVERLEMADPALLTDHMIRDRLEGLGYVTLSEDEENVLLIKQSDIDGLVEKGEAAWLRR